MSMVTSLGTYDFPSRSAAPLYGDDILVSVLRSDSMFFCAAAMFRAPKAMPFGEFYDQMVVPWLSSDPDFDPARTPTFKLVDEAFEPDFAASLDANGVAHKNTISVIGV